jgi:hypothetical protein
MPDQIEFRLEGYSGRLSALLSSVTTATGTSVVMYGALAQAINAVIRETVETERRRCLTIVATKFQECRDTEFDMGFETARKVFAVAIINPNN